MENLKTLEETITFIQDYVNMGSMSFFKKYPWYKDNSMDYTRKLEAMVDKIGSFQQ